MRLVQEAAPQDSPPESVTLTNVSPCCPECKGTDLKKDGMQKHKKRGPSQKYKCRKCKKYVSGPVGYTGRHYGMDTINLVMLLLSLGLSSGNAILVVEHVYRTKIHRDTARKWFEAYTDMVEPYTKTLGVNVGRKWGTDEKFIRIRGLKHWIFTVMDTSTRFILSYHVSTKKFGYDARHLFQSASDRAGCIPRILVSDKLNAFKCGFKKVFWRRKKPQPIHVSEAHIRNERCTNNMYERLNGTISEGMRFTRGPTRTDSPMIRAFLIHYNFFRPHMGLDGMTPAEAAGIKICGDKWRVLIQNAAMAAAMAA